MIPESWQYSRGDIYYASMEPHIGSEQGGERPVVVLQSDTCNKHLPAHFLIDHSPGLNVPSIVQDELRRRSKSVCK